ncbi:hypothetical protein C823_005103 [Eubacterium plexicaudatum ASF492]|uniref:NfeD-like C-terminal domain-containing protein n=1 Tax=Eubacterium plexicaudatum ASF492 TaxID=1235802 RepID=N2A414_9FIRM|nr:hypothetical protein C823_005103 [Eubacterium plexicaudatum ASF492]
MSVQTIYMTCMIGGILLLLSSVIFSAADDFFDFAAFDLFSIDFGDFDLDILPISMKSLCLAATVFGSVSMLLFEYPATTRHVIAGVCAYIGAFAVQNITGFLKNHQSEADTIESICSRSYVVNVSIPEQGYGSVASSKQDRSVITLTAKSLDGSAIPAGTEVNIVNIADHVAIVVRL